MISSSSIRIYSLASGYINTATVAFAKIKQKPSLKWRLEKQNPLQPELYWRFGQYRTDTLEVKALVNPAEYDALMAILMATDLVVEFSHGASTKLLPVFCSKLPEAADEIRMLTGEVPFELTIDAGRDVAELNTTVSSTSDFAAF